MEEIKKKEKVKRKQKKKRGHVVRLTPDLIKIIRTAQVEGETVSDVVRKLFTPQGDSIRYAVPSDLYESIEDARGAAIVRAVRNKKKKPERPVSVLLKDGVR